MKQPAGKTKASKPVDQKKQQRASRAKLRNNKKAKGKKKAASKTKKKTLGKEVMAVAEPVEGRPTELTKERLARIAEAIGNGHFVQAVMLGEGLSRSNYYSWLERGEKDRQAGIESIYVEFSDTIKKAEFLAEDRNLLALQSGGLGWQAHAWFLERRFPGRWGTRFKFSIDEAKDFMRKFLSVAAQHIPDREVLRKIVLDAQKIQGESSEPART